MSNSTPKSAYDRGGVKSSNKKMSTSRDQKVESCNDDDVDHNTSSNSSSAIDTISDNLGRVGLSKDDDDDKMSISDEKLFQDPPPKEDCPICMLPMPHTLLGCGVGRVYMPCCGKLICEGCSMAEDNEMMKGNIKPWCACCRTPLPKNDKDKLKRYHKRMKLNDAAAFCNLGMEYKDGGMGLSQDINKAHEMWNKAAELGSLEAHYSLGITNRLGYGVEEDTDKAMYHFKLAAIGGHEDARHFLGVMEEKNGNISQALKHFIIAARAGEDRSLKKVGDGYKAGYVTKEEYATTLRAYQSIRDEMKSDERAKATIMNELMQQLG